MTNEGTKTNRVQRPKMGLAGILKVTSLAKIVKTKVFKVSLVPTVFILGATIFFGLDTFKLLVMIKDEAIAFLPSILGFTIGGYALVVGFVQGNMLNRITDRLPGKDFSLYQGMSSNFALNIIIQAICLIIAYLIKYTIYIDKEAQFAYFDNHVRTVANWITLIIITFLFWLSLFIVIQIVVNIFNFSQLHQYLINRDKRKKIDNV